jgi:hypothetical protein
MKLLFIFQLSLIFLFCLESQVENLITVNAQSESAITKKPGSINSDSKAPVIKSSVFNEEIEKKRIENPKISTKDLANFANKLIPKYGINFWIDLADLIEKKTKSEEIEELPDDFARFNLTLTLSNNSKKKLIIDSPRDSCCCGYAYADFPVSNITSKQITLIIEGKPNKIRRTKDISFSQEHILIDNKTKSKKIRSWQVPFETQPYGISIDGTKLYIEYDPYEILLEISENGNLKFVPKNSPKIITNGKDLRRFSQPEVGEIFRKSGETGLMLFKSKEKNFIIDFPYVCT